MRKAIYVILAAAALVSCNREKRISQVAPAVAAVVQQTREIELQPGVPLPEVEVQNPYEGNYDAMNQGKRLFSWYNCAGCHSSGGGGGIGPPLIDSFWIYGNKPGNIF